MNAKELKKFNGLSKKAQAEVEKVVYDGYWNIVLKNHDRVLSEKSWSEVEWELKEMIKRNDFELCW